MNHEEPIINQPLADQPALEEPSNGKTLETEVCAMPLPDNPTVVERIEDFLRRFVFLKEESLYQLISLWALGTHLHEEFDFYGYLFLHSPEFQTGKTTLLEVLRLLVKNPSDILVSPTEAVLFRTAKGMTQLLDEVDTWANEDQLRAVLNAGFKKGGSVARTEQSLESGYRVQTHRVYCPRALAGIGPNILSPATKDRTFMVRMDRQTRSERRERFRIQRVSADGNELHSEITEWVQEHKSGIGGLYLKEEFDCLEKFSDRTIDIASPLYAILRAAYAEGADVDVAQAKFLEALSKSRSEISTSNDPVIFRELLRVAEIEGELVGNPSELAEMCDLNDLPGAISTTLRRHGFEMKSVRKPGENPKYRYRLPLGDLAEIVERYGDAKDVGPSTESIQLEQG